MNTNTDETTARSVPTLDEIAQALAMRPGHSRADKIEELFVRLRDLLTSGAYALVSREDREKAVSKLVTAGVADATKHISVRNERLSQGRSLLHLDAPKET